MNIPEPKSIVVEVEWTWKAEGGKMARKSFLGVRAIRAEKRTLCYETASFSTFSPIPSFLVDIVGLIYDSFHDYDKE
jgi:hypothetical protein